MTEVIAFPAGGYRYISGAFPYSGGVAAEPGYELERARFAACCRWPRGSRRSSRTWPASGFRRRRSRRASCDRRRRSPSRLSSTSTGTVQALDAGPSTATA